MPRAPLAREAGRFGDNLSARVGMQVIAKERERLLDGLEEAAGLGLERQHDFATGPALEFDQRRCVPRHHVGHDARGVRAACRDRLECSRHGRHRARQSFGKQLAENLGGLVGVGQPLGREPVRLVDVLLDPRPMEGAIRKGVDREDVEIVPRQKRTQLFERRGLAQCLRRDRGEPQPEPERRCRRDRGLDARQVRFKAFTHLVPALSRVDVGAVGEVDITGKMIEPHDRLPRVVSIAP